MKFPIRKRYLFLLFLAFVIGAFVLGPKPQYPVIEEKVEALTIPLTEIDQYVQKKEATFLLKENNEARVIWADSIPSKTSYSIVFVHGFSASPMAATPVIQEIAAKYGFNLYLARLSGHGMEGKESFVKLTPKDLIDSVKEAIAIGNLLGEKTIVMASSTGATLSAYLAAYNPSNVDALLFYAPLISLEDPSGKLLSYPWGLQIARKVMGSNYRKIQTDLPQMKKYWTMEYRLEGLVAVQYLLDETMKMSVFEKIHQPLFVGYYYKNDTLRDNIISVDAANNFFESVSTPTNQKKLVAFPDANTHVLLCDFQVNDLDAVKGETYRFLDKVVTGKW